MNCKYSLLKLLLICLPYVFLDASLFDSPWQKCEGGPISHMQIFGERCSGTKFLRKLMLDNFPELIETCQYGHKHFMPWLETPLPPMEGMRWLSKENARRYFRGSKKCLIIVIIRNPYDWLKSFYRKPYHVEGSLTEYFDDFITLPWKSYEGSLNDIENINPWTGEPFNNVLELRNYKNKNYLRVRNYVSNYLLVRYEDIRDHPHEFINFIAERYGIEKCEDFFPQDKYVDHHPTDQKYTPKEYFKLIPSQLQWINDHLDWEVEETLGFSPQGEFE